MNLKLYIISVVKIVRNFHTLAFKYNQFKTMKKWDCIDRLGCPIPWYTYPAIEYLKQLDLLEKSVFEYGSGNSTIFWASICKNVVAIENDKNWYNKINSKLPNNVQYYFLDDKQDYINSITNHSKKFDIIIIDGSYRAECALEAISHLESTGFFILDNSDWNKPAAEILTNAGFIEVNMSGFGPINGYTWTTAFFFSRNVILKLKERNRLKIIGGIYHTTGHF